MSDQVSGFPDAERGGFQPFAGNTGPDGFFGSTRTYTTFNPNDHLRQQSPTGLTGTVGDGKVGGSRGKHAYTPVESYALDEQNDRPLLEEVGVDFGHIYTKVMSVMNPARTVDSSIMEDSDMAGPVVFCLVLGFCLLLAGKVHFGYIYGFGAFGCLGLYSILNLMSEPQYTLDIVRVFSVLGYGLLPIVSLAAIAVFLDLRGLVGGVAGLLSILWCTYSATRFFVAALRMTPQRWLIAYPTLLFYACFALITIF